MGDTFNKNLTAFHRLNQIGRDKNWRSATITDLQPRLDWFIDPGQLMDDPLEPITIDHAMKKLNESKRDRLIWQDTNCIEGMKVVTVAPFSEHRFGLVYK